MPVEVWVQGRVQMTTRCTSFSEEGPVFLFCFFLRKMN